MFLNEPDNFVDIRGFVGAKVVICMYTTYFACIQICTKCFVSVQNSCAHTNLLRKKQDLRLFNLNQFTTEYSTYIMFLMHIAFVKVCFFIYHKFISE